LAWSILAVIVGACLFGLVASIVIAWASNRSAAWNMMFGAACGLAALLAALLIALLLTRAAFPY
jgi:hypothetical protein